MHDGIIIMHASTKRARRELIDAQAIERINALSVRMRAKMAYNRFMRQTEIDNSTHTQKMRGHY